MLYNIEYDLILSMFFFAVFGSGSTPTVKKEKEEMTRGNISRDFASALQI